MYKVLGRHLACNDVNAPPQIQPPFPKMCAGFGRVALFPYLFGSGKAAYSHGAGLRGAFWSCISRSQPLMTLRRAAYTAF